MMSIFNDYINLPIVKFLLNHWELHLITLIIVMCFIFVLDKISVKRKKDKNHKNYHRIG
ncbi:hypothetical protein JNUCC1_03311 [Lentibacillus sp. JNUCC-1]|nr:hypothetical protein [Lentibacillus sp. JNUCC-1]